ncbi:F-actin-capping protein subunit alpha [Grifola frondosa]|uniref:F-actin-capping protein subunit alpha n=1 Tax=Grifola frondosa TaxID=5627 RepID=A0A1C7M0T7_GRIFR|nr:F-actin-capping protein subunit alpha [Grifola frondosa]
MNPAGRIQAASKFLLQSPPGEINDVLNDVRNIISDDDSLQTGVLPALREYNLAQFITADVPGHQHQETSDAEHVEPDEESEAFRSALETASLSYLSAHYHDGVTSIFPSPGSSTSFIVQIVANKYNPSNFWSGRWRSEYVIDLDAKQIQGKIFLSVHYYEQGNVQLSTSHIISLALPPAITAPGGASSASKVLALIEAEEGKYQASLNDVYAEMGEKTFKGLRRALPMTRSKLDWDKVLGYKLGAELTSSKGVFGTS